MDLDWSERLSLQLIDHWRRSLRPRLDGLADEEYAWEPVAGAWSVRPRGASATPCPVGAGDFLLDDAYEEPDPPPVTTISWRMGHLLADVLGSRTARHFGGPATDRASYDFPGHADIALARLDRAYDRWVEGVATLDAADLTRPCGPEEQHYSGRPMADLVLHIHREIIHHGAEIALLRDLWTHRPIS